MFGLSKQERLARAKRDMADAQRRGNYQDQARASDRIRRFGGYQSPAPASAQTPEQAAFAERQEIARRILRRETVTPEQEYRLTDEDWAYITRLENLDARVKREQAAWAAQTPRVYHPEGDPRKGSVSIVTPEHNRLTGR